MLRRLPGLQIEPKAAGEVTMLFKRRRAETLVERLRVSLWPRRSWSRSTRYIAYRLQRLNASPHAVALGFGAGVFVSFTPFLGCHLILAALIAWIIGGSILGSALGTFAGNPLTYPLIWYATYKLGNWMLGGDPTIEEIDISKGIFRESFEHLLPLLKPMTLGSLPLGLIAAALSYYPVRQAVEAYQHRRRTRLALRGNREAIEIR
jgi:hypothetical protein